MGEFEVPEFSGVEFGRVECSGPVVPSRGRPMTLERLRAMGSPQVLPFRPSVGVPAGWSSVACPEL